MRSIHNHQSITYPSAREAHGRAPPAETSATDFLTRSEVSRLLGVSPNTVTRWAREGRLPCQVTLGGHHRFEREVVEQLQKDLKRGRNRIHSRVRSPRVCGPSRDRGNAEQDRPFL